MNHQPSETWIISTPLKQELVSKITAAINFSNNTEEYDNIKEINGTIAYQFTRNLPTTAVTPSGEQTISFYRNDSSDIQITNTTL